MGRAMIAGQVALACGLLAMTMVLARSAVNIRSVPWPFDPASVLTFEFELPDSDIDNVVDRDRRLTEIARAVNATPGVDSAALVTALPGRGAGAWNVSLDKAVADGDPAQTTGVASVTPEFFQVTRARAVRGRLLQWDDNRSGPRVAVVNESFVRRFSPDREVLGRLVFIGPREFSVVGVVPDLVARDVQERQQDGLYTSMLQSRPYGVRVMASGLRDPTAMLPSIRATLRRIDPDMPLTEIFTLHEAVYRDKRVLDILSTLFLVFGVGALSLTAVGLYGVVSFAVTQRTREIGIRMALGASRAQVLKLTIGQGSRQMIIGLAIGLVLAIGLSRGFAAAVEQLPPADAPLLLWIAAAMTVTAATAVVVPARRAVRLQILGALRTE